MIAKALAWAVCGCVAGLGIGVADAVVLATRARAMFFDAGELARAAAWCMGLCSAAGTLGLTVFGIAADRLGGIIGRMRQKGRIGYASSVTAALLFTPLFALLWQLTEGPRASQVFGRTFFVAAASLILSYISGIAAALIPAWAAAEARRRLLSAAAALAFGAAFHLIDLLVLVRLYPVFHGALTAAEFAVIGMGLRIWLGPRDTRVFLSLGAVFAVLSISAGALSMAYVRGSQNSRFAISERAAATSDLLSLSMLIAPPSPSKGFYAAPGDRESDEQDTTVKQAVTLPGASLFLLTIDAMRFDRLSLLGKGRSPAPNIDELASRSVVFSRAYSPVPHTSHAVCSLLTGKYTHSLVNMPGVSPVHETWPEILSRFRYKTGAFFTPAVFFIDKAQFEPYVRSSYGFSYRKADYEASADERVDQLMEFLDEVRKEPDPVFAWVHFFEPHEPYDPECTRFGELPEDRYDCEIWKVDEAVGRIIEYLDDAYPKAVIMVAADHGEEFNDHGGRFHGTTLYDEQARVPLIVHAPGLEARVVEEPVSLVDLLGTALSLLDLPVPTRVRSRNLIGLMTGLSEKSDAYAETNDTVMVVAEGHKAVCDRAFDICRLYDLSADPGEERSVSELKPELTERMKNRLRNWMQSHAKAELRPVETTTGSAKWPEAVQKGMAGDAEAVPGLLEVIKTENRQDVRRKAAKILCQLWNEPLRDDVPSPEEEADPEVAAWLAVLKSKAGETGAASSLVALQKTLEPFTDVWRAAAFARLQANDRKSIGDVVEIAIEEYTLVEERISAIDLLSRFGGGTSVPRLLPLLDNYQLTLKTAEALGRLKDKRAVGPLVARLKRERFKERKAVIMDALARIGDSKAAPAIFEELSRDDPPAGTLGALFLLAKAQGKRRLSFASDEGGMAEVHAIRNMNAISSGMKAIKRAVVAATARADGGTLIIFCNDRESGRMTFLAGKQEISSELLGCERKEGPIGLSFKLDPMDLDARIDAIALIGN